MGFTEQHIQQVWEKGRATQHRSPEEWRKDECGAWIRRSHYGSTESTYGWKIANTAPGPADSVDALRPLHRNNTFDIPSGRAQCRITADREGLGATQIAGSPRNREV